MIHSSMASSMAPSHHSHNPEGSLLAVWLWREPRGSNLLPNTEPRSNRKPRPRVIYI